MGAGMTVVGLVTVLGGATTIAGVGEVSASTDSEMRFYAAWYVAAGLLLLRAAPRVESEATTVRVVAGAFFLAACGRLISIVAEGTPHTVALVLMGIEFVIPVVLIPWQAAVARRAGSA
jgi:hypothetical protein